MGVHKELQGSDPEVSFRPGFDEIFISDYKQAMSFSGGLVDSSLARWRAEKFQEARPYSATAVTLERNIRMRARRVMDFRVVRKQVINIYFVIKYIIVLMKAQNPLLLFFTMT